MSSTYNNNIHSHPTTEDRGLSRSPFVNRRINLGGDFITTPKYFNKLINNSLIFNE